MTNTITCKLSSQLTEPSQASGKACPALRRHKIPLVVKLACTAFMAVLVPVYWTQYGPTNFLYFCDIALFLTLAAVWMENSLLASMAAVGIILPQMLWCADFAAHLAGFKVTGMTDYMFEACLSGCYPQ